MSWQNGCPPMRNSQYYVRTHKHALYADKAVELGTTGKLCLYLSSLLCSLMPHVLSPPVVSATKWSTEHLPVGCPSVMFAHVISTMYNM